MYKARTAQVKVEIYIATVVSDGFGGNTTNVDTLVSTRWCSVDDIKTGPIQNEAGLKEFNDTYKFVFRYDSNLIIDSEKHILKYGGDYFSIISIKRDGFRKVHQTVTAKKTFND